jgi:adenylate kinase family enzyme
VIVLTGPPGAGKSTVARLLADALPFSAHHEPHVLDSTDLTPQATAATLRQARNRPNVPLGRL